MTVLCVDPDADGRAETVTALEAAGFTVETADSIADARATLDGETDCLVTEYDLGDGTGTDLIEHARETVPDVACVLYTDRTPDAIDTVALGDAVAEYLRKGPDSAERLAELVGVTVTTRTQTAYPLPEDEDARLAALDRFAADPGALEASFDRLSAIAVALFGVDSSAIGLIDAHQERFVGCAGIDLDTLDREDTVCTYAILDDGVTVVEDLTEDPRFSDNEAIEAAGIRFYAGAPIAAPDGSKIGTFCLYDDEPRSLSGRERGLLELLAAEAADQLVLHARLRAASDGASDPLADRKRADPAAVVGVGDRDGDKDGDTADTTPGDG